MLAKPAGILGYAGAAQSELVAENGALVASLDGDLIIKGGLVQGTTKAEGLTNAAGLQSDGAVTINAAKNIILSNTTATGIIFGSNGDTVVRAGGAMTVDQARVIANGDLRVDVTGDLINWMGADAAASGKVISTTIRKPVWWSFGLLRKKVTTLRYAASTAYTVPVLQASGAITLAADRVLNQGGQINANGGALDIRARLIENAAVRQGDMVVNQSCLVVCITQVSGTSRMSGGNINASSDITMIAQESITNTGGAVLALGDLSLDAPRIYIGAMRLPTVVQRPRGIYSFFKKTDWLASPLTGGTMTAQGAINVTSKAPVELSGGTLVAGNSVTNLAGEIVLANPAIDAGIAGKNVALFRAAPLVKK